MVDRVVSVDEQMNLPDPVLDQLRFWIEQEVVKGVKGDPGGLVDGTYIASGTDWNTLTGAGVYRTEGGSAMTNAPTVGLASGALYGVMLVLRSNSILRLTQIWYPSTTAHGGTVFSIRNYSGGVWSGWKVFASTRVDNTAGRAIYQWDETANREQLIYGDTGWRAVTSWTTAGVVTGAAMPAFMEPTPTKAGHIAIRRKGGRVMWRIAGASFTGASSLAHIAGFTSSALYYSIPVMFNSTSQRVWVGGSTIFLGTVNGSVADPSYATVFEYETNDAWPTVLPGTAIGIIPNL